MLLAHVFGRNAAPWRSTQIFRADRQNEIGLAGKFSQRPRPMLASFGGGELNKPKVGLAFTVSHAEKGNNFGVAGFL